MRIRDIKSAHLIKSIGRKYYGWRVVFSTATIYSLLGGLNYSSFPVYFLPLAREFRTSYAQISLAFSLRAIGDTIGGPIGGILVDKKGPRFMVLSGMLAGGIGFIVLSFTQSYLQFLLVLTVLISLSFSMPDHGVNAGINMWFRRRLGIAMSVASSGFSLGGLILTPLVAWLVLNLDWRWAAGSSGLIMILIGVPVGMIFRRPNPGETDEEDNVPNSNSLQLSEKNSENSQNIYLQNAPEFSFSEAIRTQTYWLLGIALALRLLAQITLMIHFVPILVVKDIPEGTSAILIAVASFVRLPVAVVVGYISDRQSRTKTSAAVMFLGVGACAAVLLGPNNLVIASLFALLFGAAHAANAITWALVGQFFGRKHFGTLRGGLALGTGLATMIGPIFAGWSYDVLGTYTVALTILGSLYFVSGIIFWIIKPPIKKQLVNR